MVFLLCVGSYSLTAQEIVSMKLFKVNALDCDWHPKDSTRLIYSIKGTDTYYDIHLASPDGKFDTCLTCNHPELPNRHIANASWHPSGKWIIFIAEKKEHPRSSTHALPGFGAYCDIWVMRIRDKKCFKIVDIPNDYDHGVICPVISPDGKKIVWTDRIKRPNFASLKRTFGFWSIRLGNFYFDNDSIPRVSNTHTIDPGKRCFYECYGFSPDNSRLIFCSSMNKPSVWDQMIYTMDTIGHDVKKLTEKDYNEHGKYSPDGKKIIWMSSTGVTRKGTDWWMMNVDGTNKKRLSFMNEPGSKHDQGKKVWAGLVSFSPDGKRFISGMQISLITQEGKIWIVNLKY
ncbi:MAG: hypothetical protein ACHQF2_05745 [Flavobacteriales bacterium]